MKIEDYKEISNSVQVPDKVLAAYESAMEEIRGNTAKKKKNTGWKLSVLFWNGAPLSLWLFLC